MTNDQIRASVSMRNKAVGTSYAIIGTLLAVVGGKLIYNMNIPPSADRLPDHVQCDILKGVTPTSMPGPGYRVPDGTFFPRRVVSPVSGSYYWICTGTDGARYLFVPTRG